ncbi:hypothetical protein, partial [Photobacterium piscicola]|uniref:hypothetical protein n=1 Tax=Photobacterium piscicola TaxID=1378299 RepID=UPI003735623A
RTSHLAPRTSHLAPRTSHLAPRTSHLLFSYKHPCIITKNTLYPTFVAKQGLELVNMLTFTYSLDVGDNLKL